MEKQITFINLFNFLSLRKNNKIQLNSFLIGNKLYLVFYLTENIFKDKVISKLLLNNYLYWFNNEEEMYKYGDMIFDENERVYFIIIG